MFDFWYELPPVLRAVFGLALLGGGVAIWMLTGGRVYAIGLAALGLMFLLFAGAGNDNGYKF